MESNAIDAISSLYGLHLPLLSFAADRLHRIIDITASSPAIVVG